MTPIPFLMFEGRAEEAISFYTGLLPDCEILDIARYGPDGPGAEGSVVRAVFTLGGQKIMASDSPVAHDFTFTPAISFFLECGSEDEIARLFAALSEDGAVFMPLDDYGFSRRFGWVQDRFGVSWQLNLA